MSQPQATFPVTPASVASFLINSLRLAVLIAAATVAFIVSACTEASVMRLPGAAQGATSAMTPATLRLPMAAREDSVPAAMQVFGISSAAADEAAPTF